MPSLIDMRRRIRSVRNTQQITKAMKMISAARLRRAQERAFHARPYAGVLKEVLESLASRSEAEVPHPLLARRPLERVMALVLTGDRGLCGAFNTNITRAAERFLAAHANSHAELVLIGRKGRDYFRRRPVPIAQEYIHIFTRLVYSHAKEIAGEVLRAYSEPKTDGVFLIYNEFKSVLTQKVVVEQLLPLAPFQKTSEAVRVDYIYEQPPAEIYADLLPRYVEVQVFRALLESAAAEHAARMTAMESATNNAGEMIDRLTLNMNRIRQASITKELIEVVSGAAAL
jgi:F-type H+-transporting ATPase subunit gamma